MSRRVPYFRLWRPMPNFADYFDHPAYLWLLLLLPLLWTLGYRSLGGLGRRRQIVAIVLRSLVFTGLVLALAEAQFLRSSDRMTVIYLLDQSASIPAPQRDAMVEYVRKAVGTQRDELRRDRAALIVFGREANIEVPPVDANLPLIGQLESVFDLRKDATNLAAAMKLAQATFPEDSSRRIVIVTDGNENIGDAETVAQLLAADGIGVDVVPIELGERPEVSVERITLPTDIRQGQPFEVRAVISQSRPGDAPASADSAEPAVTGRLRLTRRQGTISETLREQDVTLQPGKNVFSFPNTINETDFYEYEATFVPSSADDDVMSENNRATAFTQVLGQGHVLLIEDWEHPGEFDYLVSRLKAQELQVTVLPSNELFSSLGDLQRYDTIVLANVPRTSGEEGLVTNFSDDQIEMLVRNTQDMGCGLVMLGGPNSFGAGGWANTELEKAMPVDFTIENAKVVPVGALAMVMHASEMAEGNYWQKKIAEEALKALGPQDYCGVIHWDGNEDWLWRLPNGLDKVGVNRRRMEGLLSRMTPGDMPDFDPSLVMAAQSFAQCTEAAVKHMIVISDGDPAPASAAVLQDFVAQQVKITTVAIGAHGDAGHQELKRIATATGGKYYVVKDARLLPRIFQREARRVGRPLVKEGLVQPRIESPHEILRGLSAPPPIRGFVLTQLKDNRLVEVGLVSPEPADAKNATILASWTYGLGRTAVLTTDAGRRWANDWTDWAGYDQLFSQLVRWSMRPTGAQENFSVAAEPEDGRIRLVVNALDKNDELLNFLAITASAVLPDMTSRHVTLRQTAPGRYTGELDADLPGSYFLTIHPGGNSAPVRLGVTVPYSAEYRARRTNDDLLRRLASRVPAGGTAGKLIEGRMETGQTDALLEVNSFRRDLARATSSRELWPLLLLLSSCLFFADVAVRRVRLDLEWFTAWLQRLRARWSQQDPPASPDDRLARLRQRKLQVEDHLDRQRAATRLDASPEVSVPPSPSAGTGPVDILGGHKDQATAPPPGLATPDAVAEADDYTGRLLRAKRQARKEPPPGE